MSKKPNRLNPLHFTEAADALGIADPALVEKDYYAVQLLKIVMEINPEHYAFIFTGGTCLSKLTQSLKRMSEDIDINFYPKQSVSSTNQARKLRKELTVLIKKQISKADLFSCTTTCIKRDEGRYQTFNMSYPKHYSLQALRPDLQCDFTELPKTHKDITQRKPIQSLYAKVSGSPPEINSCLCMTEEYILFSKFVALLRRIAFGEGQDKRLIRHVYDLHALKNYIPDITSIKPLLKVIFTQEEEKYKNKMLHGIYPILEQGLSQLTKESKYERDYQNFVGPLVYDNHPGSWAAAIETVTELFNAIKNGHVAYLL